MLNQKSRKCAVLVSKGLPSRAFVRGEIHVPGKMPMTCRRVLNCLQRLGHLPWEYSQCGVVKQVGEGIWAVVADRDDTPTEHAWLFIVEPPTCYDHLVRGCRNAAELVKHIGGAS